jgi:hypothetical protein
MRMVHKNDASISWVEASRTGWKGCSVVDGILISRVAKEEAREQDGLEGFQRGRREIIHGAGDPKVLVSGNATGDDELWTVEGDLEVWHNQPLLLSTPYGVPHAIQSDAS